MHVRLIGPDAERWAAWFATLGHETTIVRTAADALSGQLVVVTGRDVRGCAVAAAQGAEVVAVDVTDELAEAMVDAGARDIWRAGASPHWLCAKLRLLARNLEATAELARSLRDQHRVEERARDAEEQLRTVIQNSPMLLLAFDTAGAINFADGYSLRALFSPSELIGRSIDELYEIGAPVVTGPDGAPQPRGSNVAAALAGRSVSGLVHVAGKTFEYRTVPFRRGEELVGGICVAVDISERHRAEEALRVADKSLRMFLEATPDPVGVVRADHFIYVNRALAEALGYQPEELIARSVASFVLPDDREQSERNMAAMTGGAPLRGIDRRLRRKDGSVATLQYSGVAIIFDGAPSIVLIGSDVSEQRLMQGKLMLADRMASMGTMAAGIAHEINNPLAYVVANLGFVAESLAEATVPLPGAWRAQLSDAIVDARDGAERVRQIVRDLKLFSRGDERPRRAIDVNSVLESAINMAHNEIRHRAQLIKDLGVVPPVLGSDSRLCQVFVNLLINAAQAIPDGAAAVHRIRVTSDVDPTGRVRVTVSDTGAGMDAAQLARIFDPFFTTKPAGIGTGLGLSITHQIVSELGGEITVESERGRGTTFTVLMPAAIVAVATTPEPAPAAATRRARVLIIDDEPSVLAALRRALGSHHDVTTIGRAADALTLLRSGNLFDAVLCDVMMPDMNGCQLYRELASLPSEPRPRFAFLTGGVFANQADGELLALGQPIFDKPFDTAALRAFVGGM